MTFLLGLVLLKASIAIAAPQVTLFPQAAPSSDVPSPTPAPSDISLPPLNIQIGGVRTYKPIEGGGGRGIGKRDLKLPASLTIPTAAARPLVSIGTPIGPEPSEEENAAIQKREAKRPKAAKKQQGETLPPGVEPLIIKNAGVHTYEQIGRPIGKRHEETPSPVTQTPFTTIYPSSGASGIPFTEQYQVVTIYNPTTICQAQPSISAMPEPTPHSPCTTSLIPTETSVCATSLSPLGADPIAVTDCNQYVTYSTQYGYNLAQPTPSAGATKASEIEEAVQTVKTYYAATWTDVKPGVKPTGGIEVICAGDHACTTSTVQAPSATVLSGSGEDHVADTGGSELRI